VGFDSPPFNKLKNKMEIRTDLLGRTPRIGDKVAWNPSHHKGLVFGEVVDFKKGSNLPMVRIDDQFKGKHYGRSAGVLDGNEVFVPKTGFVIADTIIKIKDESNN